MLLDLNHIVHWLWFIKIHWNLIEISFFISIQSILTFKQIDEQKPTIKYKSIVIPH